MSDDDGVYVNVRDPDMLGPFIGQRVIEVTQHDKDEFEETKQSYIAIHFENGGTLTFPIGDAGFRVQLP